MKDQKQIVIEGSPRFRKELHKFMMETREVAKRCKVTEDEQIAIFIKLWDGWLNENL